MTNRPDAKSVTAEGARNINYSLNAFDSIIGHSKQTIKSFVILNLFHPVVSSPDKSGQLTAQQNEE